MLYINLYVNVRDETTVPFLGDVLCAGHPKAMQGSSCISQMLWGGRCPGY